MTPEIVAILDSIKTDTRELAALEMIIMLLVAFVLGYILRGFIDERIGKVGGSDEPEPKADKKAVAAAKKDKDEDMFDDFDVKDESEDEFDDFFEEEASNDDGPSESFDDTETKAIEDEPEPEVTPETEPEESKAKTEKVSTQPLEIQVDDDVSDDADATDKEDKVDEPEPNESDGDDKTDSEEEAEQTIDLSDLAAKLESVAEDAEEEQEEHDKAAEAEDAKDVPEEESSPDEAVTDIEPESTSDKKDSDEKPDTKISHFGKKMEPLQTSPLASFRAKDDLKRVEGVGPKIEEILNNAGIKSYGDLANTDLETLKGILDEAGSRYHMHDPTSWPEQGKLALNGEWEALETLQSKLGRKKK